MTSLIQQRHALNRQRLISMWLAIVGTVMAIGDVSLLMSDPTAVWKWILLVVWLGWVAVGIGQFVRYRAAVRAFELEHGVDAGRQG